jgi:hypothetical protein
VVRHAHHDGGYHRGGERGQRHVIEERAAREMEMA